MMAFCWETHVLVTSCPSVVLATLEQGNCVEGSQMLVLLLPTVAVVVVAAAASCPAVPASYLSEAVASSQAAVESFAVVVAGLPS